MAIRTRVAAETRMLVRVRDCKVSISSGVQSPKRKSSPTRHDT